jgi:hypothetical protein
MATDRRLGCPFVAGPACRDCNGDCWDAEPDRTESYPEPCQPCSEIAEVMTWCLGLCDGLTPDNIDQRRREYRAKQTEEK